MEKSALIDSDVNYDWNFLNYPIHTVSVKPEQKSNVEEQYFSKIYLQLSQ